MQSCLLLAYFRETILYQDTHHKQVHLIGGSPKTVFCVSLVIQIINFLELVVSI